MSRAVKKHLIGSCNSMRFLAGLPRFLAGCRSQFSVRPSFDKRGCFGHHSMFSVRIDNHAFFAQCVLKTLFQVLTWQAGFLRLNNALFILGADPLWIPKTRRGEIICRPWRRVGGVCCHNPKDVFRIGVDLRVTPKSLIRHAFEVLWQQR